MFTKAPSTLNFGYWNDTQWTIEYPGKWIGHINWEVEVAVIIGEHINQNEFLKFSDSLEQDIDIIKWKIGGFSV